MNYQDWLDLYKGFVKGMREAGYSFEYIGKKLSDIIYALEEKEDQILGGSKT